MTIGTTVSLVSGNIFPPQSATSTTTLSITDTLDWLLQLAANIRLQLPLLRTLQLRETESRVQHKRRPKTVFVRWVLPEEVRDAYDSIGVQLEVWERRWQFV